MSSRADKSLTRMLIALILAIVLLAGSVITATAMLKQDEKKKRAGKQLRFRRND